MSNNTTNDELFWRAFRYVQNELPAAERVEFETCLGNDLAACEAVAEAVRLTAGMNSLAAVAMPLAESIPPVRSPRRFFPVAVSAALVLITGLVFTSWPVFDASEANLASAELVNRWRLDGHLAFAELPDGDDVADEDSEILDESLSAPGWMMSAVRLSDELPPRP
jgi:ferric-dicitrate binding protein FerR (iron transport regulator)